MGQPPAYGGEGWSASDPSNPYGSCPLWDPRCPGGTVAVPTVWTHVGYGGTGLCPVAWDCIPGCSGPGSRYDPATGGCVVDTSPSVTPGGGTSASAGGGSEVSAPPVYAPQPSKAVIHWIMIGAVIAFVTWKG